MRQGKPWPVKQQDTAGCEMNRIKFTHYWDKLNDPVFTTIRSWNKEKEDYYRDCIGQKFLAWKAKNHYPFRLEHGICHAYLTSIQVMEPRELDPDVLRKDVTLNGAVDKGWFNKIWKMDKVIILTFSKGEPKQKILVNVEAWE